LHKKTVVLKQQNLPINTQYSHYQYVVENIKTGSFATPVQTLCNQVSNKVDLLVRHEETGESPSSRCPLTKGTVDVLNSSC